MAMKTLEEYMSDDAGTVETCAALLRIELDLDALCAVAIIIMEMRAEEDPGVSRICDRLEHAWWVAHDWLTKIKEQIQADLHGEDTVDRTALRRRWIEENDQAFGESIIAAFAMVRELAKTLTPVPA